jgi:hypothetical protein
MSTKEGDVREMLAFFSELDGDEARAAAAYAAKILAYTALKHALIAEIGEHIGEERNDLSGEFGEQGVVALNKAFIWLIRDALKHLQEGAS